MLLSTDATPLSVGHPVLGKGSCGYDTSDAPAAISMAGFTGSGHLCKGPTETGCLGVGRRVGLMASSFHRGTGRTADFVDEHLCEPWK